MLLINASAIMLMPKPEFEAWLFSEDILAQLPEDVRVELEQTSLLGLQLNATVITTPQIISDIKTELNAFIENNADRILEAEFDRRGLSMDVKPSLDSIDLLERWFDISYHLYIFNIMPSLKELMG